MAIHRFAHAVLSGLLVLALTLALLPVANADEQNKSPAQLEQEFFAAQKNFYDFFNTINSSDEFDVTCMEEVPFGVREKVHTCKAAFLRKYEERLASKYDNRMSRIGEDSTTKASRIDEKQEQLREEISTAVSEHSQMHRLYIYLVTAKQSYEAVQRTELASADSEKD